MPGALTTNVDQKLLRTTKFPPEFNTKVDMKKVNIPVLKKWAGDKIAQLLNDDDDVVPELIFNVIETDRFPKIKEMQIMLGGFLDKDAQSFCLEFWNLCISAQNSPQGVPKELLEAKKQELEKERLEQEKAREAATKRQQAEREREHDLDQIRDRERGDRRDQRFNGRHQPDRRREYRPRSRSRSRSPPRRHRDYNNGYRRRSPSPARYRSVSSDSRDRDSHKDRRRRRSRDDRDHHRRRRNTSSERSRTPPRKGEVFKEDKDLMSGARADNKHRSSGRLSRDSSVD